MKIAEQQVSKSKKEISNARIVLKLGETYNLTSKFAVEFIKI